MPYSSDFANGSHANDVTQGEPCTFVALGKPNIQYDKLYLMLSAEGVSTRRAVGESQNMNKTYIETTFGRSRSPAQKCCSVSMTCSSAT
jgi:hypothetical protein